MGNFRRAVIDFTKADALYSVEIIDNREDLCEYSKMLFGLIKSEILCNNVRAVWLVCEKGIKLTSDYALKEDISKQAMEFFYLGAKYVYILSERGEGKKISLSRLVSCVSKVFYCASTLNEKGAATIWWKESEGQNIENVGHEL